jgi:glycosyltransferase involved in cell wall biosynthesis
MRVIFFHRKPLPGVYFSIENLFNTVRSALPEDVHYKIVVLRFLSKGIFRRLYISCQAFFNRGEINHVTGDVNFIAIMLPPSRTIITMHDIGFLENRHWLARSVLKFFWLTWPLNRCKFVTTVSAATKAELIKELRLDPEKITVIPVPLSPGFTRSIKPFDRTRPRILQIGTKANKNLPRLIEAISSIPCLLDIVGVIDAETNQLLQKHKIQYLCSSNLSNEEIIERYRLADIISFVSTYEGFGMPIVEANATGRVVVTSNILSMPEVGADAAHYVDPFDVNEIRKGFQKVISDEPYRNQLIGNGFENCKRFDKYAVAKQYVSVYAKIHSGGSNQKQSK